MRVWRYDSLETVRVLGAHIIHRAVGGLSFSLAHASYLVCPCRVCARVTAPRPLSTRAQAAPLPCGTGKQATRSSTEKRLQAVSVCHLCNPSRNDVVYGFGFHPRTRQLVSAGAQQIHFWSIKDVEDDHGKVKTVLTKKAGLFQARCTALHCTASNAMQNFKRPKALLAVAFAPNGTTLTGDSDGNVYVWSILVSTIEVTHAILGAHKVRDSIHRAAIRLQRAGRHLQHHFGAHGLCDRRPGRICQDMGVGRQGTNAVPRAGHPILRSPSRCGPANCARWTCASLCAAWHASARRRARPFPSCWSARARGSADSRLRQVGTANNGILLVDAQHGSVEPILQGHAGLHCRHCASAHCRARRRLGSLRRPGNKHVLHDGQRRLALRVGRGSPSCGSHPCYSASVAATSLQLWHVKLPNEQEPAAVDVHPTKG